MPAALAVGIYRDDHTEAAGRLWEQGGKSLFQEFLPAPFVGYHFLFKVSVGKLYLKNLGLHQQFPPPSLFSQLVFPRIFPLKCHKLRHRLCSFECLQTNSGCGVSSHAAVGLEGIFPGSGTRSGRSITPPPEPRKGTIHSLCPLDSVYSPCQRHSCEREAILGRGVWAESSLESSLGTNVVWLLTGRAWSSLTLGAVLALSDSPLPSLICLCILSFPFQWCVCTKA